MRWSATARSLSISIRCDIEAAWLQDEIDAAAEELDVDDNPGADDRCGRCSRLLRRRPRAGPGRCGGVRILFGRGSHRAASRARVSRLPRRLRAGIRVPGRGGSDDSRATAAHATAGGARRARWQSLAGRPASIPPRRPAAGTSSAGRRSRRTIPPGASRFSSMPATGFDFAASRASRRSDVALLRVVKPGMLTTVQDLGRWGRQGLGVPVAGPMDLYSHQLANCARRQRRDGRGPRDHPHRTGARSGRGCDVRRLGRRLRARLWRRRRADERSHSSCRRAGGCDSGRGAPAPGRRWPSAAGC